MVRERKANFDILRVVAMLMIVFWHFLLHGIGSQNFSGIIGIFNYVFSQALYVVCSSCVNLFVLVSGFFLIDKQFNWRRIISLWVQVVFYSVGIALLFFLIQSGNLSIKDLLKYLLPIRYTPYWFFQFYFALVCIAPFLSKAAISLTQQQYKLFLVVLLFFCCSIAFQFPYGDKMGAAKGYSLIWFIALFFYGGYFRRFPSHFSSRQLFLVLGAITLSALAFIILKAVYIRHELSLEMPAYNGIGFLIAIPLFLIFQKKCFTRTRSVRIITSVAPYTFGVYLISEHTLVRPWLWQYLFDWKSLMGSLWFIPIMFLVVIVIFLVCILLDKIRAYLFQVCRVNALTDLCADAISDKINKIFN